MYEELEYEFADFKHSFDEGGLVFGRWFDEDEYEDEYPHNEIDAFQEKFIERVRDYLREKAPNQYVVKSGWCVFVMTVEEAKKRNLSHIEDFTVTDNFRIYKDAKEQLGEDSHLAIAKKKQRWTR